MKNSETTRNSEKGKEEDRGTPLEYSYIDVSTISRNDKNKNVVRNESFAILGEESKSPLPLPSTVKTTLLYRPQKHQLIVNHMQKEKAMEIFVSSTNFEEPYSFCEDCLNDLELLSSRELQRCVTEYRTTENYFRNEKYQSYYSNTTSSMSKKSLKEEEADYLKLIGEQEELRKEIENLKKREVEMNQDNQQLQHDICALKKELADSPEEPIEFSLCRINNEINNKLLLLHAAQLESNVLLEINHCHSKYKELVQRPLLITSQTELKPFPVVLPLGPLFDKISFKRIPTEKGKKSTSRSKLLEDSSLSTSSSGSLTGTGVVVDYAIINGRRLSVTAIPVIQLNWGEINVGFSIFSSYLLAYRNLLLFKSTNQQQPRAMVFYRSEEFFPKLRNLFFHSLEETELSKNLSSLIRTTTSSSRERSLEMKLVPFSDRAVINLSYSSSSSPASTSTASSFSEYLHLEGGIHSSSGNNNSLKGSKEGGKGGLSRQQQSSSSSSSTSLFQQILNKLEEATPTAVYSPTNTHRGEDPPESPEHHYHRSVLALIAMIVYTKLQICEQIFVFPNHMAKSSQETLNSNSNNHNRHHTNSGGNKYNSTNAYFIFWDLFPNPFLLKIALSILLNLSLPVEKRNRSSPSLSTENAELNVSRSSHSLMEWQNLVESLFLHHQEEQQMKTSTNGNSNSEILGNESVMNELFMNALECFAGLVNVSEE
jgi:hypothetical protein